MTGVPGVGIPKGSEQTVSSFRRFTSPKSKPERVCAPVAVLVDPAGPLPQNLPISAAAKIMSGMARSKSRFLTSCNGFDIPAAHDKLLFLFD
ncbi:hypothetical protein [Mesorhizobium sp. SP-1A]|uniref:hypothetical protein n=1 Tax=Mesorhizobium sp. SP-1A TaxID=3077840 RepID=UPI0028F6CACD|nr:hypothetical protein [Mesorhizobium sp. SP-1A]